MEESHGSALGDGSSEGTLTVSRYEAQLSKAIKTPIIHSQPPILMLRTNKDVVAAAYQPKPHGSGKFFIPKRDLTLKSTQIKIAVNDQFMKAEVAY